MLKTLESYELIQEQVAGELYAYYPLGEYVVLAPGICGGRPTLKYTRLETSVVLADIAAGYSIDEILQDFELSDLPRAAILEAIDLANQAFLQTTQNLLPLAV